MLFAELSLVTSIVLMILFAVMSNIVMIVSVFFLRRRKKELKDRQAYARDYRRDGLQFNARPTYYPSVAYGAEINMCEKLVHDFPKTSERTTKCNRCGTTVDTCEHFGHDFSNGLPIDVSMCWRCGNKYVSPQVSPPPSSSDDDDWSGYGGAGARYGRS